MKKIIYLLFISLFFSCVATKGADGKPGEMENQAKTTKKVKTVKMEKTARIIPKQYT